MGKKLENWLFLCTSDAEYDMGRWASKIVVFVFGAECKRREFPVFTAVGEGRDVMAKFCAFCAQWPVLRIDPLWIAECLAVLKDDNGIDLFYRAMRDISLEQYISFQ